MPNFDIKNLWFSLLIVRPKFNYINWVKQLSHPHLPPPERRYHPEEDSVWLIPQRGSFAAGKYEQYVQSLKPLMARYEFERFLPEEGKLPGTMSANLFDEYFDLELRDLPVQAPADVLPPT